MDLRDQPQQSGYDEERAEDTDPGNGFGAAVKDLRHYNATRAGERTELNPFASKARLLFCETFHVIVQSGLKLRHFGADEPLPGSISRHRLPRGTSRRRA